MLNLVPIECEEYFSFFTQILEQKRKVKNELIALNDIVESRYQTYCTYKEELSTVGIHPFSLSEKEALLNCYEGPTKSLDRLKKQISELQNSTTRGKCQYCGIGVPTTYDHYMPKGIFPEYSVLPINLVPCCFDCNTIRKDKWLSENRQRQVINLYFDRLSNIQYLFSSISYSDNIPESNFYMSNTDETTNQSFELLQRHCSTLNLENRYKLRAGGVVAETKRSIVIHADLPCSINKIKQWLLDEAKAKRETFGVNYWEASLMDGLANSNTFLQDCLADINLKAGII